MSERKKRLSSWFAFLLLVLVCAGGVGLLVASGQRDPAPEGSHWLEAATHIQERFEPGDVIRLEPTWLTGGRIFFADLDGGAAEPFRILDIHNPIDPTFLYRFQRLWLVSALDRRDRPALDGFPIGAELLDSVDLERLQVRLFELPGKQVIKWSFNSELGRTEVQKFDKQSELLTCRFRGTSFRCGKKTAVEVALRQVAGGPRRCVNVTVGPDGRPVVLIARGVPGPGTLFVTLGQPVEAARAGDGSPTDVVVSVNGAPIGQLRMIRRDYELHRIESSLSDGDATLEIRLEAADSRKREVCINAVVLDVQSGNR